MRIAIHKPTGRLLEAQEHATEGTLIQNAVNAGYQPDEIEERTATMPEVVEMIENTPEVIAARQRAAQRAQTILDSLPSWSRIDAAIDEVTSLAAARTFLRRLSKVVYILARSDMTDAV